MREVGRRWRALRRDERRRPTRSRQTSHGLTQLRAQAAPAAARAPRRHQDRQQHPLRPRRASTATATARARRTRSARCTRSGIEIVVVSSGAVAAGMARLGLKERPKTVPQRQAAAAVGQIDLMALYEEYFAPSRQQVAQILLTHDDLANRRRYLNARHTFETLLACRRRADRQRERHGGGRRAAQLRRQRQPLGADRRAGRGRPAGHPERRRRALHRGSAHPRRRRAGARSSRIAGRGAAAYAMDGRGPARHRRHGVEARGGAARPPPPASRRSSPTACTPASCRRSSTPTKRSARWFCPRAIASAAASTGSPTRSSPPAASSSTRAPTRPSRSSGRSLLPKGLTAVDGKFGAGDCVRCVDPSGREFARGLVNYSAAELEKIKGLHSAGIEASSATSSPTRSSTATIWC